MRLHRIGSLVALATACCHPPTPAMIPKGRIAASILPGHVLFRVPPGRVEDAARAWEEAGFVVVRGGPSEDLVNAMIYFPDGWFIELFGLGPELRVTLPLFFARFIDPAMHTRFGSLVRATGEEWLDWSVDVTNLARVRDNLDSSGVSISSVRSFARTQSDGSEVAWELAMPEMLPLPFLKSPYRGHLPIPVAAKLHPNGVRGIAAVVLEVPDVEAAKRQLMLLAESTTRGSQDIRLAGVRVVLEKGGEVRLREVVLCVEGPDRHDVSVRRVGSENSVTLHATPCALRR